MIEIKNKRMILFREDRLIGAAGDVNTSNRKFVLDAMQGECDLSPMMPWIKIDPKYPGENAYDQLLKKEIVGDKIILTWNLTAKNLQRGGEISAQIIFASPEYFLEDDFENILDNIPMVPSPVVGSSAPVWQSYPETFVIEESIVNTESYKELTKNVLVASVAESISASEAAQNAAETAQNLANSVAESEQNVLAVNSEVNATYEQIEELYEACSLGVQAVDENAQLSRECMIAAENAADVAQERAEMVLDSIKKANNFRLIYTKTLTAEDADCYAFEITQDLENSPFSLSEFTVFLNIPKVEAGTSAYLQIKIQPDYQTADGEREYGIITQYAGADATGATYQRIECANRGRWRANIAKGSAWNQNGDTVYHTGAICSTSRFTDGKNATAILLQGTSATSVLFPEGTMIEIWGIDAVKEEV